LEVDGGFLNIEVGSLSINTNATIDKSQVRLMIIDPRSVKGSSLCKGAIGGAGGNKFCTRTKCGIVSHKTNKTSIPSDTLRFFICKPRAFQANCQPSLPVNWVESEKDRLILEQEKKISGCLEPIF
jgi:hypothetical protein